MLLLYEATACQFGSEVTAEALWCAQTQNNNKIIIIIQIHLFKFIIQIQKLVTHIEYKYGSRYAI